MVTCFGGWWFQGDKLGAYMIAAEQLAYVFPLIFMFRKRKHSRFSFEFDIFVLLLSGLVISLLLPHYWSYQVIISGRYCSVGLLTMTFLAGAVCSSSGIVFFPYVAPLPKVYTSALATGSGLSGLLAALFTIAANSGSTNPRIGIHTYLRMLSGVYVLSLISFLYVRNHRALTSRYAYRPVETSVTASIDGGDHKTRDEEDPSEPFRPSDGPTTTAPATTGAPTAPPQPAPPFRAPTATTPATTTVTQHHATTSGSSYGSMEGRHSSGPAHSSNRSDSSSGSEMRRIVIRKTWPILLVQFLLSALAFGVMPSILPIACSGYQDASGVLMASTVGYMIADPLGRFATYFIRDPPTLLLAIVDWALASLLITCALMRESPPLGDDPLGGYLVPFAANTLFSFTFAFTSTGIFCTIRKYTSSTIEAETAYRWSAFMIQTGAFLGTFITLFSVVLI